MLANLAHALSRDMEPSVVGLVVVSPCFYGGDCEWGFLEEATNRR
jgi:hypothetical protein